MYRDGARRQHGDAPYRGRANVEQRLNPYKQAGAYKAMVGLQRYVDECGLDKLLLELVKIRVSQINGCAFCIAMHVRDTLAAGETPERLHLLAAWRDAPLYTPRERAALAWAEAVARIPSDPVSDALFAEARAHFSEAELVDLTTAVNVIGAWNRYNVAFRVPPQVEGAKAA